MKRLLCSLAFVVVCANADTLSASVSCNGQTFTGPAVSCGTPQGGIPFPTHASASPTDALAFSSGTNVSASADVGVTYMFEITNAPGPLLFEPCLSTGLAIGGQTFGSASASLLGFFIGALNNTSLSSCNSLSSFGSKPAPPVGVAIPALLGLEASSGVGRFPNFASAEASFTGLFYFFDL